MNIKKTSSKSVRFVIALTFGLFSSGALCVIANNDTTSHVGDKFYKNGDYRSAKREYSHWLERHPESISARLGYALSLKKNGDAEHSVPEFRAVLQAQPDNKVAMIELSDILSWKEQTRPEAMNLLRELLAKYPEDRSASLLFGKVASWNPASRKQAIATLQKLQQSDGDLESLLLLAKAMEWDSQMSAAEENYKLYLSRKPDDRDAATSLARVLSYQSERRQEALDLLDRLVQKYPNDIDVLLTRAQTLISLNAGESAIAQLKQLLEKQPDDVRALKLMAEAFRAQKQYEVAEQTYSKLLAVGGANKEVSIARLEVLAEAGRGDEAIKGYQEILSSTANDPAALAGLAHAYMLAKRSNEALPILQKLAESSNTTSSARQVFLDLAELLLHQGRWQAAVDAVQPILRQNPHDSSALFLAAGASLGNRNVEAAKSFLDQVPAENHNDVIYLKLMADVAKINQQWATAEQLLKKVPASDQEASVARAEALLQLERAAEAEEVLRRVHVAEDDYRARGTLVKVLARQKKFAEASIIAKGLIEKIPPDEMISIAQELSGSPETRGTALSMAKIILAADPQNSAAQLLQGRIFSWAIATQKQAVPLFESYLKTNPSDKQARQDYADLLSWIGNREESLNQYNIVLDGTSNLHVLAGKARVESWNGKISQALKQFRAILQKDPTNRTALLGLAQCQTWSGDYLSADQAYVKAVQSYPDDLEIKLYRAVNFRHMGRYDKAIQLLKECKALANQ